MSHQHRVHQHRVPSRTTQVLGRRSVLRTVAALVGISATWACSKDSSSTSKAPPSRQKLGAEGTLSPTGDDRCPMCAMRVADNPAWAGAIELDDGSTYYACCIRCTLATSMNTDKFLGVPKSRVKRVRVPHYLAKGKSLDAETAWYVIGSDVRGPMGLSLLPAKSEEEAKTLVERHGGRLLRRHDVTMAVLEDLKNGSKGK